MTSWYKFLLFYLWIAPHVFLVIVAVILLNRRMHRTFPAFVLYIWYEIAEFAVLFAISVIGINMGDCAVHGSLVTLALSTGLRFGVLQKIFDNVFRENGPVET